jgi:hypothetical protein
VLGDGRKRQFEGLSELVHRRTTAGQPGDEAASCRACQGGKQRIQAVVDIDIHLDYFPRRLFN